MVRHGQASYMSEDYDRLSPIGEEQAVKLGEFWVRHEIQFDACFQGPAKRHLRTAEIAADVVKAAGIPWPETEIIEDVDEFEHAFPSAGLQVYGYVSPPAVSRSNRQAMHFFVNRRAVQSRMLGYAVEEAARAQLRPIGRRRDSARRSGSERTRT